jgi:hypothetical protein
VNRHLVLGALVATALGLVGWSGLATRAGEKGDGEKGDKHTHFDKCSRACADCMRECESCAHHCAHMVAEGKKEHLKTLGTCADCAEFCAAAAKIVSRGGPMRVAICESCAKACDVCGAACEEFSKDKHMARCAKECRECAKECREMIKHTGPEKEK